MIAIENDTDALVSNGHAEVAAPPLKAKRKFIAICTPSLGTVSMDWATCMRQIQWPANTGYLPIPVRDVAGNEIAECRNRCVMMALQYSHDGYEVDSLFWLDDDVLPSQLALKKLASHNRDIVSGVYFMKEEIATPLIFPGKFAGTTPFVPNQVYETWGHGMGLCLVKLDVYRRMAKELSLPRDKYGNYEWYKTVDAEMSTLEDGQPFLDAGRTEDLYFLDLAAQLGYRPLVDTSAATFGWHYESATGQGYPREQWAQFKRGEAVTWPTPEGYQTW